MLEPISGIQFNNIENCILLEDNINPNLTDIMKFNIPKLMPLIEINAPNNSTAYINKNILLNVEETKPIPMNSVKKVNYFKLKKSYNMRFPNTMTFGDKLNCFSTSGDFRTAQFSYIDGDKSLPTLSSDADTLDGWHLRIVDGKIEFSTDMENWISPSSGISPSDLLTQIKLIDGSGSGIDADLLDGLEASAFSLVNHDHNTDYLGINANAVSASKWAISRTITLDGDLSGNVSIDGSANVTLTATVKDSSHNHIINNISGLQAVLDAKLESSIYTASDILAKLKTVDGTTSGLDADLLDGLEASAFSLVDHEHNTVYLAIGANATSASRWATARTITLGGDLSGSVSIDGTANVTLTATVADDSHNHIIGNVDGLSTELSTINANVSDLNTKINGIYFRLNTGLLETSTDNINWTPVSMTASSILTEIKTVDGIGSGLDADLLDGLEGSYYLNYNNLNNKPTILELGETLYNAYRGDRGKIAYDHSQLLHAPSNAQKNSDITKAEIEAKLTGTITTHIHNYIDILEKGVANGIATLDSDGKIVVGQLPSLVLIDIHVKYSEAEQLALSVQQGDVCIRGDLNKSFIALNSNNTSMSDWQELLSPLSEVQSVNGKIGAVILSYSDVGALGATENAVSASKWVAARTITLGGDLSGSVSIDGTTNVTLTATVADNSHDHSISNVSGLQTILDSKLNASSYTANDILTKLLTVDGTTSGLDADLLDGNHASAFSLTNHNHDATYLGIAANATSASKWAIARTITLDGDLSGSVSIDGSANVILTATMIASSHSHDISNITGLQTALDSKLNASSYTANDILTKLLTVDGTNSGLDADMVDGYNASSLSKVGHGHSSFDITDFDMEVRMIMSDVYNASDVLEKLKTVDGPGSNLDADLLDGNHASAFALTTSLGSYLPKTGGTMTGDLIFSLGKGLLGTDSLGSTQRIWGFSSWYPNHGIHFKEAGANNELLLTPNGDLTTPTASIGRSYGIKTIESVSADKGFIVGNFEMIYNNTTNSLDFCYTG